LRFKIYIPYIILQSYYTSRASIFIYFACNCEFAGAVPVRQTDAGPIFEYSQVHATLLVIIRLPREPQQIVGQRCSTRRVTPTPLAPAPLLPARCPVVQVQRPVHQSYVVRQALHFLSALKPNRVHSQGATRGVTLLPSTLLGN
jgi:hypothetical protein